MKIIPFSPPDITELEIKEVVETLKSGWITTGKRTKLFEKTSGVHRDQQGCMSELTDCIS